MAPIDEKLNVRTEIEQSVAKQCNYTEFNPVFEDYWQLYNTVKNHAMKDISAGSVARQCSEFNALVTRRMYEAGMAEEKKNWTSWDK